jgi:hypothetical protein
MDYLCSYYIKRAIPQKVPPPFFNVGTTGQATVGTAAFGSLFEGIRPVPPHLPCKTDFGNRKRKKSFADLQIVFANGKCRKLFANDACKRKKAFADPQKGFANGKSDLPTVKRHLQTESVKIFPQITFAKEKVKCRRANHFSPLQMPKSELRGTLLQS